MQIIEGNFEILTYLILFLILIFPQDKLPKEKRRPVPTAPENFDKVISGEIKGKELVKMNQKAFEDYNETSLLSCQWCGR